MAGPKRLWDNYKVIGDVKKSEGLKLVVGAGVRDGVRYINIREFYLRKKDGAWMPGRDGVSFPLRLPVENATKMITPYADMLDVLIKAAEELETMEIYDENNAVYIERK